MEEQNNNEVPTCESTTPQNLSAETTAVVSNTANYTADKAKNQSTNDENTQFYSGEKLIYGSLAFYLIKNYNIVTIDDMLYIYIKGIYVNDVKQIERLILNYAPNAKPAEIKTVLTHLRIKSPEVERSTPNFVAFINCIVNIDTLEMIDFDPKKYIITNRVYTYYRPESLEEDSPHLSIVKSYLHSLSCNNFELETLYLQIYGYCMVNKFNEQRAFLLKGNTNNGKSTFLKTIEKSLRKHCSHLSLEELSNRKSLSDLFNCTANIVDDTGQPKKFNLEQIQSIVTGGTIPIKQNNGSTVEFEPTATLLIATTKTLYFKNFNDSFTRRFIVVPFNANFETEYNKNMQDEICNIENLSILATMAIQAYSVISKTGSFTVPKFVEEDTQKYFYESNPILEFVKKHPIARLMIKGEYIAKYKKWCEDNGKTAVADNVFGKKLIDLGYYKSADPSFDGIRNDYYAVLNFNADAFRNEYVDFNSKNPGKIRDIFAYIDYLNKQNGL